MLDDTLKSITIGRHITKTAVVAYADDVTIFLTFPGVPTIRTALDTHGKASGAHINIHKSKVMAICEWGTSVNVLNIPYCTDMEILGYTSPAP
jgi:peroxiredoxin family protein